MGVLARAKWSVERRDTIQHFAIKDWLGRIVGPGAPITPSSAMRLAVVFTCIRIIAEGVASMPLVSYRRLSDGGRERAPDFYLSELLRYEPNPEMTAVTFVETLTAHVAGWGNGYAEIVRDAGNRPTALWPLRPDRMTVLRENGNLVYRYNRTDGRTADLTQSQVLHLPGLSFDGLVGYSVLGNQQAIELAQTLTDYGIAYFANGGRPGAVLSHPKTVSQGAIDRITAQFDKLKGSGNAGKTLFLEEGLALNTIGVPPQEAQYVEGKKFSRQEIIGMFRIPPHKAGDTERSTSWGAGIEAQNRQFLDEALASYLVRWEQGIRRSLITSAYRRDYYVEFNRDVLLRGDTITRYQAHHLALMDGWMNDDEIRELENRNRKPDGSGQIFYKPAQMLPESQVGTEQQASAVRSWLASGTPFPDPMQELVTIAAANGHAPVEVD